MQLTEMDITMSHEMLLHFGVRKELVLYSMNCGWPKTRFERYSLPSSVKRIVERLQESISNTDKK